MLASNERDYAWHCQAPWVVDSPSTSFFSLGTAFTRLRRQTPWLQNLPYAAVRYTLKHQAEAWSRYFKGAGGRPQFKSKYKDRSVTFPEATHFRVNGNRLYLQKLGWFRIQRRGGDPYVGCAAMRVTIKRDGNKWYAVVLYKIAAGQVARLEDGKAIGVDMNCGQVATSEGAVFHLPLERMRLLECRKKRYQRRMARQVIGSNRRAITKMRCAKASRDLRGIRNNWQHQTSHTITAQASTVVVEKLKTSNMTKTAKGGCGESGQERAAEGGIELCHSQHGLGRIEADARIQGTRLDRSGTAIHVAGVSGVRVCR